MPDDPVNIANLAYAEIAYAQWCEDPASVSADWRALFEAQGPSDDAPVVSAFTQPAPAAATAAPTPVAQQVPAPAAAAAGDTAALHEKLNHMIRAFRLLGHTDADVNPLGKEHKARPELTLEHYGFTDADLDVPLSNVPVTGAEATTLRALHSRLRSTYCRSIGVQYMHIDDIPIRHWLEEAMEGSENRLTLSKDQQTRIFAKLTDAEMFEQFIQKKFPGMKRFSLEGGETLIPLMDAAIEEAGASGVEEVVIGMAHRGRLNVLANIMQKSPRQIFREFMDADPEQFTGQGDVKYHMGYSSDCATATGQRVHLSLCFNPSHLAFVAPVVIGRVRSKQDRRGDAHRRRVMGMIVHGDAAFAGQGVVQELFNMSELAGYRIGGTIHIILNNQIGFTTPPQSGRSTRYATEVARMLQIPIFHVNGEDPEGVLQVVQLAMEFRRRFQKDVVIDMYCFRKYGHNEGDEPMFTQPLMYKRIRERQSVREGYLARLVDMGMTREAADAISQARQAQSSQASPKGFGRTGTPGGHDLTKTGAFRIIERTEARLEEELQRSHTLNFEISADAGLGIWRGFQGGEDGDCEEVATAVPAEAIAGLMAALTELPDDFNAHRKVKRILQNRMQMPRGERGFDWGGAEAAAFASILQGGHRIRLAGQDVGRGTFSHRHAVLHDQDDGRTHVPLDHLSDQQGTFEVFDSPLSEVAVVGFEFGYSLDNPEGLTIWEAQFGDFANVAQVMIDQFISSCEDKWFRLSSLVMLLPHGFEGQGPEHSSARLERYLTLCAEDNIQVVNLTTPAQYFHCLRRQVLRPYRKPLVVMSPKSLLRHPRAVSSLDDLTTAGFQRVITDNALEDPAGVKRVLMCTGKLFYELESARSERQAADTALVRFEQLYPISEQAITDALAPFPANAHLAWVQEEPENMGAWRFIQAHLRDTVFAGRTLHGVTRPASASPATGSAAAHRIEQDKLIEEAFTLGN